MHCNSLSFIMVGLIGAAVAPPPPTKTVTTVATTMSMAGNAVVVPIINKTVTRDDIVVPTLHRTVTKHDVVVPTLHKTVTRHIVTTKVSTTAGNSAVFPAPHPTSNKLGMTAPQPGNKSPTPSMFTTVGHKTTSTPTAEVTTPGDGDLDQIKATLADLGMSPSSQTWTTIHLSLRPSASDLQAHKTIKSTRKNSKSTTMSKATKTKSPDIKAAPTHVAPSTCTTYYPSVLRQISEEFPDVMQENTANTTKAFLVGQSVSFSDKVKFDRIHQYVAFHNITPGSWDCQLMVSWPDVKHSLQVKSSSIQGSSAVSGVSLDVYSASYNVTAYGTPALLNMNNKNSPTHNGPFSTWANMMNAIKASGNRQLPASDSGKSREKSDLATSAKLTYFSTVGVNPGEYGMTINSQACPASGNDMLQFLFEMPSTESREASVNFLAAEQKGAGVYLIANC